MQKKRKKPRKLKTPPAKKQTILPPEEQAQRVRDLLAEHCYKDAVDMCKQLIKQENRPEWIELLVTAYKARSQELTDKKMHKEALVIWRNRAELCNEPLIDAHYVQLLLAANVTSPVITLYLQQHQTLAQQGQLKNIREYLAARSLGGSANILRDLPADDMIAKDHSLADSALTAYCAGDDDLLNEQLKAISYRSPYRDLKQILKAMSLLETEAERAVKLLERIPENSFFLPLATAVLTAQEPELTLFSRMVKLKPEALQLTTTLRGYNSTLSKFINELKSLSVSPTAASLMRFIIKNKKLLGRQDARDCAYAVLTHELDCIPQFVKAFGMPSQVDCDRSEALQMEVMKEHPLDIVESWENVAFSLKPEDCQSEAEYHLRLAMIVRRKLMHIDRENDSDLPIIESLEKILLHDPLDRENYIRIIADYRQQRKLSKSRSWLDKAMKHFPDDMLILIEAVETALASEAYKKAATLAKRVLDKDPINPRVRICLIDAHLSHARKLLAKNKIPLAEKELNIAEAWGRTEKDTAQVTLLRGVIYYTQGKIDEALTCWQVADKTHGGGLCGHFHLLQELLTQKLPVAKVLKQAKISLSVNTLNKADFLAFFQFLGKQNKKQQTNALFVALSKVSTVMKKGVKQQYSETEFEMICETFVTLNQDDLLLRYANQAYKKYDRSPVFNYYQIVARTMTGEYLTRADNETLEKIVLTAQNTGDKKFVMRIVKLMQESSSPFGMMEQKNDGFSPNTMPEIENLIDIMIRQLPQNEINDMRQELGDEGLREFIADMINRRMNDTQIGGGELEDNKSLPERKKQKKDNEASDPNSQLELF